MIGFTFLSFETRTKRVNPKHIREAFGISAIPARPFPKVFGSQTLKYKAQKTGFS